MVTPRQTTLTSIILQNQEDGRIFWLVLTMLLWLESMVEEQVGKEMTGCMSYTDPWDKPRSRTRLQLPGGY